MWLVIDSYMRMCGYGVYVGKVQIFSASIAAFYHFKDPHIRISAHQHFTRGHSHTRPRCVCVCKLWSYSPHFTRWHFPSHCILHMPAPQTLSYRVWVRLGTAILNEYELKLWLQWLMTASDHTGLHRTTSDHVCKWDRNFKNEDKKRLN